jgi:SAM-dependent methyltransferase
MSKAFFDRWFPGEPNNGEGFYAEVSSVLPATGKILDLGCGANYHLAFFRTPRREVWGTDLQRHPQLAHPDWFRRMPDSGTVPFDDAAFDLVTAFMVLEHIADPPELLREVARVLRPGGHFIAHTICSMHYVTWVRRVLGWLPHSWNQRLVRRLYGRDEHDTFPAHYRMNTPARVARLARPFGLEATRVRRYACPGYFEFSSLLYRGAVVADWLLDRVLPDLGRIYFTATFRKGAVATADVLRSPAKAA